MCRGPGRVGFLVCSFLEREPSVGTEAPEASDVDIEGRMATSSARAVGRFFRSDPSREAMSESRDVHHSPEGNFCMRAYFRFRGRSGEESGSSTGFDKSAAAPSLPIESTSGLVGITVSRLRVDSVARKEDWSRRERARLQNLSCCAAGADGRERGWAKTGNRGCTADCSSECH